MPKESTLQKHIMSYLRDRGAYVFKVVGSPMQDHGTADLLACYRGRFIAIEVKLPGEKESKMQEVRRRQVQDAGGITEVVHSMEELKVMLEGL